jgi:hypothetical protein
MQDYCFAERDGLHISLKYARAVENFMETT